MRPIHTQVLKDALFVVGKILLISQPHFPLFRKRLSAYSDKDMDVAIQDIEKSIGVLEDLYSRFAETSLNKTFMETLDKCHKCKQALKNNEGNVVNKSLKDLLKCCDELVATVDAYKNTVAFPQPEHISVFKEALSVSCNSLQIFLTRFNKSRNQLSADANRDRDVVIQDIANLIDVFDDLCSFFAETSLNETFMEALAKCYKYKQALGDNEGNVDNESFNEISKIYEPLMNSLGKPNSCKQALEDSESLDLSDLLNTCDELYAIVDAYIQVVLETRAELYVQKTEA